jgi:hypothetical protein
MLPQQCMFPLQEVIEAEVVPFSSLLLRTHSQGFFQLP